MTDFMLLVLLIMSYFQHSKANGFLDLGNAMGSMADPCTKTRNANSHYDCIGKCMQMKGCKFFLSAHVPEDTFSKRNYKCTLSRDPAKNTEIYYPRATNRDQCNYIEIYPSVILGACADHKCDEKHTCAAQLTPKRGYTCLRKRVRRRKKKDKCHVTG